MEGPTRESRLSLWARLRRMGQWRVQVQLNSVEALWHVGCVELHWQELPECDAVKVEGDTVKFEEEAA
eukprot:3252750-Rhodomonas_salina.2